MAIYNTKKRVTEVEIAKKHIFSTQMEFALEHSLLIENVAESITLALLSDKIPHSHSVEGLFIRTLALSLAQKKLNTSITK